MTKHHFVSNGIDCAYSDEGDKITVSDSGGPLAIAVYDNEYWHISYYDEHGEIMDLFDFALHENRFPHIKDLAIWLINTHPIL